MNKTVFLVYVVPDNGVDTKRLLAEVDTIEEALNIIYEMPQPTVIIKQVTTSTVISSLLHEAKFLAMAHTSKDVRFFAENVIKESTNG